MTPTTALAVIVSALGQASLQASGEVLQLDKRPIPGAYMLQGLAAFTVYAPPDVQTARYGDGPFVEFKGLQAHSTDPGRSDGELANYASIQLSLVSELDYDSHVGKGPVCGSRDQWGDQLSLSSPQQGALALTYTVRFTESQFGHQGINKTGVYFLIMSNCGNVSRAEVSGQVAVRNPFGYVSGIQYHKLVFYGYTTLLYLVLLIIWGVLCLTWRQVFMAIHAIVGVVIGLKLLECVSWTAHLYFMNLSGTASNPVVRVLVMLPTLISYTSYMFILMISQGWRMTEEVLEDRMLYKLGFFGVCWIFFSYLHEGTMVYRQSLHIAAKFTTIFAVGSVVVNIMVFLWMFSSLVRLSKSLRERNMEDQLKAVSRFTVALLVSAIASAMVASLQLLDSSGSLQVAWKYQYLVDGGLSQVVFACVVIVAMWVWMPSAGSGQLSYAAPEGQDDGDILWKDDDDEDEEERGGNRVAPATVGAADEDL